MPVWERRLWPTFGFSLGSGALVLQAPVFDSFAFDLLPFQQDGLPTSEVDIGWREIVQALVIAR